MSSIYPISTDSISAVRQEANGSILYQKLMPVLDNLYNFLDQIKDAEFSDPKDLEKNPLFLEIRDALISVEKFNGEIESAPRSDYIDYQVAHSSPTFVQMNNEFKQPLFSGDVSLFKGAELSNSGNNDPLANVLLLLSKKKNEDVVTEVRNRIESFEENPYE